MTTRLEISRLAPARADPLRSVAGWFPCGARSTAAMPKGSRIPGAGRRWSAGPSPSRELDRDSGFADESLRLDRRRVAEGRPARLFGEGGEGKPMRNFPACKPLKYHKTAKYSGADAVMRTPPAGSPRGPKVRCRKSSRTALGQRGAEMEGNFSCPQTIEISQNRKIIPRRSGRRDGLSRKPAMTSSQPGSR